MIAAATSSGKVLLPLLQNMVHHTLLLMCNFGSTAKPSCEKSEREREKVKWHTYTRLQKRSEEKR